MENGTLLRWLIYSSFLPGFLLHRRRISLAVSDARFSSFKSVEQGRPFLWVPKVIFERNSLDIVF